MLSIRGVHRFVGMATSWLYVDPTFHNNKINKVLEMLDDIKEAFASLVSKTDWMDKLTKTETLQKSQKMKSEIGYPEWIFDEESLDGYYEGVSFTKNYCN